MKKLLIALTVLGVILAMDASNGRREVAGDACHGPNGRKVAANSCGNPESTEGSLVAGDTSGGSGGFDGNGC